MIRLDQALRKSVQDRGKSRNFNVLAQYPSTPTESDIVFNVGADRFKSTMSKLLVITKDEVLDSIPGSSLVD
jgi:hypothetical protein